MHEKKTVLSWVLWCSWPPTSQCRTTRACTCRTLGCSLHTGGGKPRFDGSRGPQAHVRPSSRRLTLLQGKTMHPRTCASVLCRSPCRMCTARTAVAGALVGAVHLSDLVTQLPGQAIVEAGAAGAAASGTGGGGEPRGEFDLRGTLPAKSCSAMLPRLPTIRTTHAPPLPPPPLPFSPPTPTTPLPHSLHTRPLRHAPPVRAVQVLPGHLGHGTR